MRRVFFSFHYERDIWRAAQVRNSQKFLPRDEWQFLDAAEWEQVRKTSSTSIQRWINDQLHGTSVTVVLIGAKTSERHWVDYEIKRSIALDKGLLGIRIHALKDANQHTDYEGANPLPGCYQVYRWIPGYSENKIGSWLEKAARDAGR